MLTVNSIPCNPVVVADDITILSTRVKRLQEKLDTLESYSCRWRFDFNTSKTIAVTFGETTRTFNKNNVTRNWKLYNAKVEEKRSWTHVEIELSGDFNGNDRTKNVCKKAKETVHSLMNLGARSGRLNPMCGAGLWKTNGIPTCLYGCELWNTLGTTELNNLERAQRYASNIIQGLGPNTRTAIYAYRQGEERVMGFIPDVMRLLQKYNLQEFLETYINEQYFPRKAEWRKIVLDKIGGHQLSKWKLGMNDKPELCHYKNIHQNIMPFTLCETAKRNPFNRIAVANLVNIVCGNVPDIFMKCVQETPYSYTCQLCYKDIVDINKHLIMECCVLKRPRNEMWDMLYDILPLENVAFLNALQDDEDLYEHLIGAKIPNVQYLPQEMQDKFCLNVANSIMRILFHIKISIIEFDIV
ncbi:Hypothetical predicted protein [Paramuricea clavata]|uniref:Uncharacterized protein n=1 Tax=Paramuricea clavata TaxID=317549 RepID=A0A7D9L524_PARCT|nr:Hypothetical predicted protein [Paramuricea clavata]